MEKLALITGASKGIGKELALVFAKNGYSLILLARNTMELEQLQKELYAQYRCEAKILSLDLAQPNSVAILLETFKNEISQLDILVNNAGVGLVEKFADMPSEALDNILKINIEALTKLTQRILPFMLAKKSGKILNVASTAGFMPGPYMSLYYASKAYVLSLSQGLYEECKRDGVIVSTLCPGPTRTPFLQRARMDKTSILSSYIPMMTPEKVALLAYEGLMKNKRIIIPGIMNKLSVMLAWLFPNWIVAKITAALQKPNT